MQLRGALPPPIPVPARLRDPLAVALLAAELAEPFPWHELSRSTLSELFDGMAGLRVCVPYATLELLGQLTVDPRADVRAGVARSLPWFADLYPERAEKMLLPLASDSSRRVRASVAESLADLIEASSAPWTLIARWDRQPERTREVLRSARKRLPPPLGT